MRHVACPVALHPDGAPLRIPVFQHPQAGLQLIKGGVRAHERPEAGAARELFEESGLETRAALALGRSHDIQQDAIWHFALCRIVPPVRTQWLHHCADDGGHLFKFHWHAINDDLNAHPIFQSALSWIRTAL